ncbi:hypothetical protein Pelo_14782 [Pelomyxa schiedti]|nr:hypothetical protein Pelo_14782 [Pelomyxa schiedti]
MMKSNSGSALWKVLNCVILSNYLVLCSKNGQSWTVDNFAIIHDYCKCFKFRYCVVPLILLQFSAPTSYHLILFGPRFSKASCSFRFHCPSLDSLFTTCHSQKSPQFLNPFEAGNCVMASILEGSEFTLGVFQPHTSIVQTIEDFLQMLHVLFKCM